MTADRSRVLSPARRAALEAIAMLGDLPVSDRPSLSVRQAQRLSVKLRWLYRWAQVRALPANKGVAHAELDRWVAQEARHIDPRAKVSARSLRRWRDAYNAIGSDGLAGGPAGLIDAYKAPAKAV